MKRILAHFRTALQPLFPPLLLLCLVSGCPLYDGSTAGHRVRYSGNGSMGGGPPLDPSLYHTGNLVTVMDNTGILSRAGHGFAGWNTEPDGSGADRAVGTDFIMGQTAIVLYAKWIEATDGLSYVAVDSGYEVRKGRVEATDTVVIPEFWMGRPVVSIGKEAFADCASLMRVTIPGKVAFIGDHAFRGCTKLVTVVVEPGRPPTTGASIFEACRALAEIKVPRGSLPAYASAQGWESYAAKTVPLESVKITYHANCASGGAVPVDTSRYFEGDPAVVSGNAGALRRADCGFDGWNTMPDGSGESYEPGDILVAGTSDITLHAVWDHDSPWFRIVNSWGIGGSWEKVPDGKFWMTAEALKKAGVQAFVIENIDDCKPRYLARFAISHPDRSHLSVSLVAGDPAVPAESMSVIPFSFEYGAGSLPLGGDTISVDVSDWARSLAAHDLYLSIRDDVAGSAGSLISFTLEEYEDYASPPVVIFETGRALPAAIADTGTTRIAIPCSAGISATARSRNATGIVPRLFPARDLTARELADMKSRLGIRERGRDYNRIIMGCGTGLAPPSEREWEEIARSFKTIDSSGFAYPGTGVSSRTGVSTRAGGVAMRDLSLDPEFPPIGHQGQLGSCVAYSLAYYIASYQEAREDGRDLSASGWNLPHSGSPERNLDWIMSPKFLYNLVNGGKNTGSSYPDAIRVLNTYGCASWKSFPYDADYRAWPDSASWKEAPLHRSAYPAGKYSFAITNDADIEALCALIDAGIPVSISIDAGKYAFLSEDDVWDSSNYVNPVRNHANTLVGYMR